MAKNTTTRWDALSMRDRASLIKLYSQSGIRKLDDMRTHYNKLGDGGEEDKLWYNPEFDSDPGIMLNEAVVEAKAPEKKTKKSKQDKHNDEVARMILRQMRGAPRNELNLPAEKPLESEDYLLGLGALGAAGVANGAIAGTGSGLANAIEWVGEKAMPSSLLKGISYYLPDVAGEMAAISPYADAAALMHWTNQGYKAAKSAFESGDTIGGIGLTAIGSLPWAMPVAFNYGRVANDIKTSVKTARRAVNEIKNLRFDAGELANVSDLEKGIPEFKFEEPKRVVNENGSINKDVLVKAYRDVLDWVNKNTSVYDPKHSLNEVYNSSGKATTLKKHISNVVKTAQEIPVPKGSSRAELVRSALAHDIGKIITGQEGQYPQHGAYSAKIMRELQNEYPEFSWGNTRTAVRYHMYDPGLPVYGAHGIQDIPEGVSTWGLGKRDTQINYDLIHALQAADVARGMSYDEAAMTFPQLFTYYKENPFNVKFYNASEAEQLKHVINPLLKRQGYATVKTAEELENTMQRHRSFYRGVRDPYIEDTSPDAYKNAVQYLGFKMQLPGFRDYYPSPGSAGFNDVRNAVNSATQAMEHYGINTPTTRMLSSLEYVPLDYTGYGRASVFGRRTSYDPRYGFDVLENDIGPLSSYLKASPSSQDAVYASVSPRVMKEYATASSGRQRDVIAARLVLPNDPIKSTETLPEFYERSNFQLYAGDASGKNGSILGSTSPMSNFQLFEEPYRLQTGRSLRQDMLKEYNGKRLQKIKNFEYIHESQDYSPISNGKRRLDEVGNKFGVDFSKVLRKIDDPSGGAYYLVDKDGNYNDLLRIGKIYWEDNGSGLGLSNSDADFLASRGYINPKIEKTFKALNRKVFNAEMNLQSSGPFYRSDAEEAVEKYTRKLAEFTKKYILNKQNLYRAKNNYFKNSIKGKFKPAKEMLDYLNDRSNIISFMRKNDVHPLYEMPSFGKTEMFSTNGQDFGYGPKTRSFSPSKNASQGVIIGNRGEKVFDAYPYSEQDLLDFQNYIDISKVGKFRSGSRDAGIRYAGEDPRFAVTRKTHANGGILDINTKFFDA